MVVIVPCSVDLLREMPAAVEVGYVSKNEFDQRVAVGTFGLRGFAARALGAIDPALTAAMAGTVTGNTRLTSTGGGIVVIAIEVHREPAPGTRRSSMGMNVPGTGDRAESDIVTLPFGAPPPATATPTPSITPTVTASPTRTPVPPDAYEPDGMRDTAQPIACGEDQLRSIHVAFDQDWARFSLAAPSAIRLGTIGPGLELYNADGELTSIPDLAVITRSCGEDRLSEGTYYVNARAPSVIPSYELSLECTPCVTPTATASETATASPSETPTLLPTPRRCAGDCDGGGSVDVAELVRGVNILLGTLGVSRCAAFDLNRDERVTVAELVRGVNAVLRGCAANAL